MWTGSRCWSCAAPGTRLCGPGPGQGKAVLLGQSLVLATAPGWLACNARPSTAGAIGHSLRLLGVSCLQVEIWGLIT